MSAQGWAIFVIAFAILFLGSTAVFPLTDRYCAPGRWVAVSCLAGYQAL